MPTAPKTFRGQGSRPKLERDREADARRGSARQRGYTRAWDKASRGHLRNHPLCVYCEHGAWGEAPRIVSASLVDHLYPHKGDTALFWDKRWWASCCADCHSGPKQAIERRGHAALDRLARLLSLPTLAT